MRISGRLYCRACNPSTQMLVMVDTKHHKFSEYADNEYRTGPRSKTMTQIMRMYRTALAYDEPTILELGVNTGNSTTVFLTACEETGGHLVSVDVKDCSDVADSSQWTFVQSDSSDKDLIIEKAPILRGGIDVVLIDSLHHPRHVQNELSAWIPLVNPGGTVILDDVDPWPYRRGAKKANWRTYLRNRKIRKSVIGFYREHEDNFYLSIDYGSTGLAVLRKLS